MMNVLKRIYELRKERGWSEYQLAEASEISQSTISSWYRKGMLPSIGSLEKICKGFTIAPGFPSCVKKLVELRIPVRNRIPHLATCQFPVGLRPAGWCSVPQTGDLASR